MINLNNICKTYDSGGHAIHALNNINLSIQEGEVFGIIGRSGAGKSTLIRMLNLLERPTSGKVEIDQKDITQLSDAKLREFRHGVGMIFQHFNLLSSRKVIDNVAFPLRLIGMPSKQRQVRAREMLDVVGLSEHANAYPAQLSGGQRQRVGIARALAAKPRLLLCDEATSALDPETTQSILNLLRDINDKLHLTIVLITHSMDVIRNVCDRVAVIEKGAIVEQGEVLDVFLEPQQAATQALLSESGLDGGGDWQAMAEDLSGKLIRLNFRGHGTGSPLLSRLSRELQLDFNILSGTVGRIKHTPYGQLIVAVNGELENMQKLESELDKSQVRYEVLRT